MVSVGVATAMSTTFDDNIYLSLFFSRTNRSFRPIHVVVGEFVGFSTLIGISLIGFLLGRMVDSAWVGLLGFMPIVIGINTLLTAHSKSETGDIPYEERVNCGPLVKAPHSYEVSARRLTLRKVLGDARTYKVSAVTIANGGNNIAIYIPLFANSTLPKLGVVLLICYMFIGLWCLNSWILIRQPRSAVVMSRVVSKMVPFILIALGLSIIVRSGTAQAVVALAYS